jgi:polynucleotide 5'-kinase involved in rRNA processing
VFIGSSTPSSCPLYYLNAIRSILKVFEERIGKNSIPLVVNTHGWNRGLGLELCVNIFREANCKHIIQLSDREDFISNEISLFDRLEYEPKSKQTIEGFSDSSKPKYIC